MAAAISLRSQLSEFQLKWAKEMAALGVREPSAEQIGRLVESVRSFTWEVNDTIRNETQSWLVEFNTTLAELESRLRQSPSASSAASGPGSPAANSQGGT